MKGTPKSTPSNHVEWINGFKSNMPDWKTARECAIADEMLAVLKDCRTILFTFQRPMAVVFTDPYDQAKFERTIERAIEVINKAEGTTEIINTIGNFPPPSFPKPPGMP